MEQPRPTMKHGWRDIGPTGVAIDVVGDAGDCKPAVRVPTLGAPLKKNKIVEDRQTTNAKTKCKQMTNRAKDERRACVCVRACVEPVVGKCALQ